MRKLISIISIIFLLHSFEMFAAVPKKGKEKDGDQIEINENQVKKILLSSIGEGFQNIGGKESVGILYSNAIKHNRNINQDSTLEIGCKNGKTTNLVYHLGCKKIWGADINEEYIKQAQEKYNEINFVSTDITKITKEFDDDFFSFMYSLNILNAVDDKIPMLQRFKVISRDNALIALTGYYLKNKDDQEIYKNLSNKIMYPIRPQHLKQMMGILGWKILEEIDISDKYVVWQRKMIANIQKNSESFMIQDYTEDEIRAAIQRLDQNIKNINANRLGAVILIAKKI